MANNQIANLSLNPSSISDLTGVNVSEGCQRNLVNNAQRQAMSMVKAAFAANAGTITAASTLFLSSISTGDYIVLTATGGSSSISSFGDAPEGLSKRARIIGSIVLRHDAAKIALPGGADLSLSTGDEIYMRGMGSNLWNVSANRVGDAATGKHLLYVGAKAMQPASLSGATFTTFETTTNKHNYTALAFDNSATEYAYFEFAMPKSYNSGTISYRVRSESQSNSGGVVWALTAVGVGNGDSTDGTWGTAVTVNVSMSTAHALNISAESSALTIGGSVTTDDLVQFRINRSPQDASDTLATDAWLRGVDIFIVTDKGNDA